MLCQKAACLSISRKTGPRTSASRELRFVQSVDALRARAQMRFADLESRRTRRWMQSTPADCFLSPELDPAQDPLQQLSGESEIGSHRILKLLAVKSAVQRRKDAPVEEAFHLVAGVARRHQIEPQLQHRLDQR